jgi:phosphoribosylanthranilate isomerase
MKVKICGITNPADAKLAAEAGADAIGLNFADSPRRINPERAAEIVAALPPLVTPVGIFVDADPTWILDVAQTARLGAIQLHGQESTKDLAALRGWKIIKAIRVRDEKFVEQVREFTNAKDRPSALLYDAYAREARGGTGKRFDWDLLVGAIDAGAISGDAPPMILAGGLTPENVSSAIRRLRPYAVDVSSGVETKPGKKSSDKVFQFITSARKASAFNDQPKPPAGQ